MTDKPNAIVATEPQAVTRADPFAIDEQLVRDTICRGATQQEFALFIAIAKRLRLDPLARQIFAVKRWDSQLKREVMTAQLSIDAFRLTAQRTGQYRGQTEPQWCGQTEGPENEPVWLSAWLGSKPPAAARCGVWREGFKGPLYAVARYASYVQTKKDGQPNKFWSTMPDVMLSKCFDEETAVLTSEGFKRFAAVGHASVLMVQDGLLVPTNARPFRQQYDGEMVSLLSDDLNFCVTPNHDMVTSFGKVEARAMLATSHCRGPWRIPRSAPGRLVVAASDKAAILAGYIVADGYRQSGIKWRIDVSRPSKIEALRELGLHTNELVRHARGDVAVASSGRRIRSNFDKAVFTYDVGLLAGIVNSDKQIDRAYLATASPEQSKATIDAWQAFDGYTNKKTGVRRLYCSDLQRIAAFELLAVKAGYAVSPRRARQSDTGAVNYSVTISARDEVQVYRHANSHRPSITATANETGAVWCVTVPSGVIVVRRHGFSMLCGNCAEAIALRKAFPMELSGAYSVDEMGQAENDAPEHVAHDVPPEAPALPPVAHESLPGADADYPLPNQVTTPQLARLSSLVADPRLKLETRQAIRERLKAGRFTKASAGVVILKAKSAIEASTGAKYIAFEDTDAADREPEEDEPPIDAPPDLVPEFPASVSMHGDAFEGLPAGQAKPEPKPPVSAGGTMDDVMARAAARGRRAPEPQPGQQSLDGTRGSARDHE